jgi:hypothetical protein
MSFKSELIRMSKKVGFVVHMGLWLWVCDIYKIHRGSPKQLPNFPKFVDQWRCERAYLLLDRLASYGDQRTIDSRSRVYRHLTIYCFLRQSTDGPGPFRDD